MGRLRIACGALLISLKDSWRRAGEYASWNKTSHLLSPELMGQSPTMAKFPDPHYTLASCGCPVPSATSSVSLSLTGLKL